MLATAGRLESTFDAAEEKEYARPEGASFLPRSRRSTRPRLRGSASSDGQHDPERTPGGDVRGCLGGRERSSETRAPNLQNLTWLRRGLWVFVLAAGAGAAAMTLANEGLDGLDTPNGLKVLIGLAFAASGLYAWGRRPENRLGPLMTIVGCTYLLAQILIQAHVSAPVHGGHLAQRRLGGPLRALPPRLPRRASQGEVRPLRHRHVRADGVSAGARLAALLPDRRKPRERAGGLAERRRRRQRRLGPARAGRAWPPSSWPSR